MSSWSDRFDSDAILASAKEVENVLDLFEDEDWSTDVREDCHRFKRVVTFLVDRFSRFDPELSSSATLDAISKQLVQIQGDLNQFRQTKNSAYINKANSTADSLLQLLSQIWIPESEADIAQLRDSVGSFRKSVSQNARYAEEEFDKLKVSFAELMEEFEEAQRAIESQKARTDSIIDGFQDQFSTAQESRRSEYSSTLDAIKSELESLRQEHQEEFKETIKSIEDEASNQRQSLSQDAGEELGRIKDLKEQAESLLHVIGNTGMAGGYQKVADNERTSRRNWNKLAITAFIGMVGFAVFAFFSKIEDLETFTYIGRFGVVLTFGAFAAYAAQQASKHHKMERDSRRMELELASLNPFLAEFSEEDRNEIKRRVAMTYFGNRDDSVREANKEGDTE